MDVSRSRHLTKTQKRKQYYTHVTYHRPKSQHLFSPSYIHWIMENIFSLARIVLVVALWVSNWNTQFWDLQYPFVHSISLLSECGRHGSYLINGFRYQHKPWYVRKSSYNKKYEYDDHKSLASARSFRACLPGSSRRNSIRSINIIKWVSNVIPAPQISTDLHVFFKGEG